MTKLDIAVVGPGALGTLLGLRLAEAGFSVGLVPRHDVSRQHFVNCSVTSVNGRMSREIVVLERVPDAVDLTIFAMKIYDLKAALTQHQSYLSRSKASLFLQSSLDLDKRLRRLRQHNIWCGATMIGGTRVGAFQVVETARKSVALSRLFAAPLGQTESEPVSFLQRIAACRCEQRWFDQMFVKVAINAVLGRFCIEGPRSFGEVLSDSVPRRSASRALWECAQLARALNIRTMPESHAGLEHLLGRIEADFGSVTPSSTLDTVAAEHNELTVQQSQLLGLAARVGLEMRSFRRLVRDSEILLRQSGGGPSHLADCFDTRAGISVTT